MDKEFTICSAKTLDVDSVTDIDLVFCPDRSLLPGSKIWLFYDMRQDAGIVQKDDKDADNFLSVKHSNGQELEAVVLGNTSRTLDLYPSVPEFHVLTEIAISNNDGLVLGQAININISRWKTPLRPIKKFHFWLVADRKAEWDLVPTGYKSYRIFVDRVKGKRIDPEIVVQDLMKTAVEVQGQYKSVPAKSIRKTPGVFWGELHGMAFNQRSLDDFYDYAKNITRLDFCAAIRFSYNTCVGDEWQEVKDAVKRHSVPGKFIAFAGVECGTPGDDSHRCAYFPKPDDVPPIFCESRPPAQDPMLHKRFHPDTVFCKTLDEFYAAVKQYGGFVGGHFHTTTYNSEILAEMWQKQNFDEDEEERIYEYMRKGKRFGLVGGSDTHDSMPGNPYAEPGCPRPAGFTGVWADELTVEALTETFCARRVYATSGARIILKLDSNNNPMGSELPLKAPRIFNIKINGTARLTCVELLKNGCSVKTWQPGGISFEIEFEDEQKTSANTEFYLVKVKQIDGHIGWSSPIWFG